MTHEIFLMRVMHRTGLDDRTVAKTLVRHVVERLGTCLTRPQASGIADRLPAPLGEQLVDSADGTGCELEQLYRSVAEEMNVDVSFGLEFTQVVCQVLGEAVGPTGRELLETAVAPQWHPLFEPREGEVTPPGSRRNGRQTLSSGQPGSSRPLSEAIPGHRNSIAHPSRP